MNFPKKFQRRGGGGGGSFSIQRIILYLHFIQCFLDKNCIMIFPKWGGGGGGKACLVFSKNSSVLVLVLSPVPINARLRSTFVTFTFAFVRLIRREQNAAFQKRKRRWLILASVVWKRHFLCLKHLVLSSINQADRNRERPPLPRTWSILPEICWNALIGI